MINIIEAINIHSMSFRPKEKSKDITIDYHVVPPRNESLYFRHCAEERQSNLKIELKESVISL